MIAATPQWVSDAGAWIGLALGLCGLVGALYGFSRWTRRSVEHAVREIVVEEIGPVRADVAALREELRTHVEEEARAEAAAAELMAELTTSVRNLEQYQAPHLGGRASEPDPVKE